VGDMSFAVGRAQPGLARFLVDTHAQKCAKPTRNVQNGKCCDATRMEMCAIA
jgi:hypothetical protein